MHGLVDATPSLQARSHGANCCPASAREVELVGLDTCRHRPPARAARRTRVEEACQVHPAEEDPTGACPLLTLTSHPPNSRGGRASLGKRCTVEVVPQLYRASEQELLEQLQALPESVSSVMLIGHNPGLHNLALVLASRGAHLSQLEEKFPTCALATLVFRSEGWTALGPDAAELVDYVVPRQLG